MATTQTITNSKLPPYLPFATFQAALQSLRVHGIPDKLERTAWESRSGGEKVLISSALRFFGLIDDQGVPQPILRKLTGAEHNSDNEKAILKTLIEYAYSDVFKLNLATATIGLIAEAIGKMGVTGATRDRSVRFFIKAANYSGVELSSRLTDKLRTRNPADTPRQTDERDEPASNMAHPRRRRRTQSAVNPAGQPTSNAVKTVSLRKTSGELTLSGTFNPFDLDGEERKLVYDIIDLMKKYEGTGAS